ncbi:protein YhfH [Aciduricibacillus chroicocephali]|uniref:Protein YhfH n=1 Tax=Aciduricibacillus chroicocephali TaxID=3054939 RepID=A0ABY9L133_9BACI|nr:protein YhfH [Bacillaceae bacterium 44XB]
MNNIIEFFKKLPKRKCRKCGHEIREKADCYVSLCDDCDHPAR